MQEDAASGGGGVQEDVSFDRSDHPLRFVGQRVLKMLMSDISASSFVR